MKCPNCQTDNPDAARFCLTCGTSLAAPRPVEGERKYVTVLFADVVGSTSIGEQLDPEQVAEIMNGAIALMNAPVAKYGGTVARLMGDAILAFFGAPQAHEDDPERAVRAALEIQSAMAEYTGTVRNAYGVDFSVRVGINTGLAVLATVGDQIKTEYTAMGDAVNLAARLQSAAEPGTVLLGADTYRLVKHIFDFQPRDEITVKGKSAPVLTYEVLAPKQQPEKARGLEREGLSSPLVGRAEEFAALMARVADLREGRGGFVIVTGEAGLGKSRLLAEVRRAAGADAQGPTEGGPSVTWLEGRAVSYGQTISYYPWRMLIRQSVGAHEDDPPATVREKLYSLCDPNCCIVPGGDLPFIEAMLSVASDESLRVVEGLEGDALVRHITEAVRGYVCGLAQEVPLVLVFDDLHWADEASLELLVNVADLALKHRLLAICLLRPDRESSAWASLDRVRERVGEDITTISLEPLSPDYSRELLGNLLFVEDLPESVRKEILDKAEGNPFFVEEVIRSLIASGHIVRDGEHWRAQADIATVAIPDTLVGVLTSRIDRLPDDTKRAAQMASIIGRIFAYRVLKVVCANAPETERIEPLEAHLDRLVRDELVRERAQQPELEYGFKHALTHEAVYNSLLLKRRKEFHLRAGATLEQLYAGRLDELAPVLAHHFLQAEEWERAAQYSIKAGGRAFALYALYEAITHYERAIAALDRMPDPQPEMEIDAVVGWSESVFAFKPYAEILQKLERVEQLARQIGDKRRLAYVLYWKGKVYVASGYSSRAIPAVSECLALAAELGDEKLSVLPGYFVAFIQIDPDPRGAIAQLDHVIELARKHGNREIEGYAAGAKAMALARLGDFEAALQSMKEARKAAQSINNLLVHSDIDLFAAWAYLDMGDPQRALQYAEHGIEEAIQVENVECICVGFACVGFGRLQSQQFPEALEAFQETIRRSQKSGAVQVENVGRAGLALTRFHEGRAEGVAEMEGALAKAHDLGSPYQVSLFSEALGQIHLTLGNHELAESYLNAALKLYRDNGMRPYLSRTLGLLADLHGKVGRTSDAHREREEAERLAAATLPER
jgi:class 3 adenylate cyclase/tetratricopeptide (TPR) repeat protein